MSRKSMFAVVALVSMMSARVATAQDAKQDAAKKPAAKAPAAAPAAAQIGRASCRERV